MTGRRFVRLHVRIGGEGRKHWRFVGAALCAISLASLAFPPTARAATLYVDAAAAAAAPGTGCGAAAAYTQICSAPGPGTGTPCAAGSALADAGPGDTIEVCAGTYNENVEISLSNITLRGAMAGIPAGPDAAPAGRGTGESIIVGQTTSAIHLAISGVTGSVIDGFTIQSGNFPAIHDNPNGLSGAHVWSNNIIEATSSCGPALINLNRINGSQILNNNLSGCQWGISVQSGNSGDSPSRIEGNYFVDNSPSAGAIIMAANNAAGHIITGNLIEGTGAGMILGCADLEITDNLVRNRGTAIFLHTNATGATITGNDLLNDSNGVRQSVLFGPYTLGTLNEVHYNNIEGSTLFGARNEVTPGDQDIVATCNWWGSADGPFPTGSGDEVTAGVDFVPWLVAPAPEGVCIGGLACTSDLDCTDGVGCNGAETCDLGTGTCIAGTPVTCDDGSECTTDACVEPAGTCEFTAEPDGSACDTGDVCSEPDMCVGGICEAGGGGDADMNGVCDGDEIDSDLVLYIARIRQQRTGRSNGAVLMRGDFITNPVVGDTLDASSTISVRVFDGRNLDENVSWEPEDCKTNRTGTSIRCKSPDRRSVALFHEFRRQPGVFRYTIRLQKRAIDGPFKGPSGLELSHGSGMTRLGTNENCRANSSGIYCRLF